MNCLFWSGHEIALYWTSQCETTANRKLRIPAFDWYQACVLGMNINAIQEHLEISISFTGSQNFISDFFSFTGTLIYRIYGWLKKVKKSAKCAGRIYFQDWKYIQKCEYNFLKLFLFHYLQFLIGVHNILPERGHSPKSSNCKSIYFY